MPGAAVIVQGVSRRFDLGPEQVWALQDVSLEVASGEFLALIGRSGSGKTTLLNLIAGLDKPTEGDLLIDGRSVPAMSERELNELRRHNLGFVFQSFGLLPLLSAYENVELPLRIAGMRHGERARRTRRVLDMVGLGRRAEHRPYELSGGEQQRVAIARALAIQPSLILADEPTGELDSATATAIFTLMRDVSHAEGVTIITSTHDRLVMEMADRVEELSNGRRMEGRELLRRVQERERSPFAAPLPAEPLPESAAAAASRPSSLIGADTSQFARPVYVEPDGTEFAPHRSEPEGERAPRPTAPPPPAAADDEAMRWAPPDRRG
jgi:ABC-type lipoprotein export system ATPase subunit